MRARNWTATAVIVGLLTGSVLERSALANGAAAADEQESASASDRAAVVSPAEAKAAADKAKEEFRAARRDITTRLRNRDSFERAAALRDLEKFPTLDAVKLVVSVGLKDNVSEVRTAAFNTLLEFKDNPEVARHLLLLVGKDSRRGSLSDSSLPLIAVLLASDLPDIQRELITYLDKQGSTHDGLMMVEALADELGDHGQAEDVASLKKLIGLHSFDREFGLRRAVVQALTKINEPPAIGQLVVLVAQLHGELQGEIVQYLTQATGQEFGPDGAAWRAWWKENEKTFQFAAGAPRREDKNVAALASAPRNTSMYYGLSIYAQKLVFIIDTSGSMIEGGRLLAAKRELLKAIDGLPEDSQFSIISFNNMVQPWQKQLVPASATAKKAAMRWVEMLETQGGTASYDALETALHFDAEAIFFLTDGAPFGGKITAPPAIVEAITRLNYVHRMSIYSIGIGAGAQGSVFDTFLSTLSKQNWGIYRRVDQ